MKEEQEDIDATPKKKATKKKKKATGKNSKHYVDNKVFNVAMIEYIKDCRIVTDAGKNIKENRPTVSNYIAECFMKISERLSYSPNFVNYTFKDEMVCDGIENCLLYMHNFNPDKSSNPFSYFTQIIYFAFLRRIQKEKKQQYVKLKSFSNSMVLDILYDTQEFDKGMQTNSYADYIQDNMDKFLKDFEESYLKKTIKKKAAIKKTKSNKKSGLEKFSG